MNTTREVRGERHGRAILTENQVRLLRKLHSEDGKGGTELWKLYGDEWGISQQALYAIITYRTWKHVESVQPIIDTHAHIDGEVAP